MEEGVAVILCRHRHRQRCYQRTAQLLEQVAGCLASMNPDSFLMFDGPDGYGYRRIPFNTFYQRNLFAADEDEPGITIPWPPGEAHMVAYIFHLAGVECMLAEQIMDELRRYNMAHWSVTSIQSILSDPVYHQIGLRHPDPFQKQSARWTLIAEELSRL